MLSLEYLGTKEISTTEYHYYHCGVAKLKPVSLLFTFVPTYVRKLHFKRIVHAFHVKHSLVDEVIGLRFRNNEAVF